MEAPAESSNFSLKLSLVGGPPADAAYPLLRTFIDEQNPPARILNHEKRHQMGEHVVALNLWDLVALPGNRAFSYRSTRAFIIVFDFCFAESLKSVGGWHKEIEKRNEQNKAPVILLGVRGKTTAEEKVKESEVNECRAKLNFNAFITCSLHRDSVKKAFDTIIVEALFNNPVIAEKKKLAIACYPHITRSAEDRFVVSAAFVATAVREKVAPFNVLSTDLLRLLLSWLAKVEGCRGNPSNAINLICENVRNKTWATQYNGLTIFGPRYTLVDRIKPAIVPVVEQVANPQQQEQPVEKRTGCYVM